MEKKQNKEVHVLCMPFPAQGHISPMLQLCKRLASKGLRITLITNSSSPELTPTQASSINVEQISDGFKEGEMTKENVEKLFGRFIANLSQSLADLIEKHIGSKYPPKFLIYDEAIPWAVDVARRYGIDGAPLCTTNMAVHAIYYLVRQGKLKHPLEGLPSMLLPGINDLQNESPDETRLNEILNQFSNFHQLNFLFVNTFDKLEDEVVKWMNSQLPVKTIGPTIPSMYLDKRLEEDRSYGLSFFKPDTEACIEWLDSKETASVVYISFGSWCELGGEQMEELAWGLKRSNCNFLWVVKESEQKKLPSNFIQETSEKGLVVTWSPQLEVLAHKSVGCFMTHCGWNSILEALSLGVPLVAMPQWSEQKMNAQFVADVWEIGVKVRVNEKGIVTKEEIETCIRQIIMHGERGKQIRTNSEKWKKLAKEAVDDGGSSDKNIEEFIAKLVSN